jgi:hypothetical protein
MRSPEERRIWAERGRCRTADFAWRRAAEGTLAAYETALSGKEQ